MTEGICTATRAEILGELAIVLQKRRRARDDAKPDTHEKHNIGINRLQAGYDFIMKNMADEHGRIPGW